MMRKIINVLVLFFLATSFSLAQTFENAVIQFESREYSAAKDSFLSLVVSEKK